MDEANDQIPTLFLNAVREDLSPCKIFIGTYCIADYIRILKRVMQQLHITLTAFSECFKAQNVPQISAPIYSDDEYCEGFDFSIHLINEFRKATGNTTNATSATPRNRNTTATTPETPTFRVRARENDITDHQIPSRNAVENRRNDSTTGSSSNGRTHHDISLRLKSKEDKFSGNIN